MDNIVGTSGNDTINATNTTYSLGDVINGGDGNDTLYAGTLANTFNFNIATVTNVENLVFENASGSDMDGIGSNGAVNVGNIAGLKNVAYADKNSSAKNVKIETKANVETVSVKNAAVVTVTDNATSGDKLASVTVENSGGVTVNSDALTTLSLKDTSSAATVNAAAGTRTLTLNVNNVTGGATIQDNAATKLVINATGKASNIALTAGAATALDVAGDQALTIATAPSSVTAITSTNTAGVTITSTLGNNQAFTGGDGKDSVAVGATTKTIDMGKGDDTVIVTAALGAGGALKGGDGADTLVMSGTTAATLTTTNTFANAVDGFERLSLNQIGAGQNNSINLANLDDISYVKSAGTASGLGTPEVVVVAFGNLLSGQQVTVGGVTYTAPVSQTGAQVAAAFASAPTGYTITNVSGNQVTFTATSNGDQPNLSASTAAAVAPTTPSVATTHGVTPVTGVTETATVSFVGLIDGESVTVGGRTITASGGNLTAAQVAALAASGTSSGFGVVSGTLTGWTAGAASGNQVTFTSTTANANVTDIINPARISFHAA